MCRKIIKLVIGGFGNAEGIGNIRGFAFWKNLEGGKFEGRNLEEKFKGESLKRKVLRRKIFREDVGRGKL